MALQTQSELMIGINNALVPKEGPKTIPVLVDLRTASSALVDLTQQQMTQKISFIQTIFVDNSLNTESVSIQADTTNQILRVPAGVQAYLPILSPIPPRFIIATTGAVIVPIQFLNIPMPYGALGLDSQFAFGPGGELLVSDSALDALISDEGGGDGLGVNILNGSAGGGSSSFTRYFNQLGGAGGAGTLNIATGAPRFILHSAQIWISPFCYLRSGSPGIVTVEIRDETAAICSIDINLPGAPPSFTSLAPGVLYNFEDLDILSAADGNRLRINLSADVGSSSSGIAVGLQANPAVTP